MYLCTSLFPYYFLILSAVVFSQVSVFVIRYPCNLLYPTQFQIVLPTIFARVLYRSYFYSSSP